jgi:hypothetical protein
MKKITKFAAVALLVAGSIACTERKTDEGPGIDPPAAVTATEPNTPSETTTTVAPTTDPAPTATDTTATDATTTDGTSAPANPPAQQ